MDKVLVPLNKDHLLFEKVFIHTNKTAYFTTDYIWFKAYVGAFDNKPSLKTTRLYVNLLDSNGKIIQNKDVLIYKGTGKGQFKLNDTLKSGKYYIQAYTNYMRNFGENKFFVKEITILNNIPEKENVTKNNYDIQVFPEGGYLLEDVENVIGIKSLINGKGYNFSGTIINSTNKEVASFKSEHLGMTKCSFFYEPKEKYKALIAINDTLLKIDLPLAKSKGVILSVNNQTKEFVNFTLKTNTNSLVELNDRKYNLLFHQRNKIINFLEILKIDSINVNLKFEKKFFLKGVNSITLFENNQPIVERKIFIEKETQEVALSLREMGVEKDSIHYTLKISDSKENLPIKSNISISVLPLNTLSFNEKSNIKSAFLLTPYIKGNIENPAYYFNKNNLKRKEYIDLLLLTQGWTQYTLEEMIESLNPPYNYNFEFGFKLKGSVSPLLSNQLALITQDNLLIDKLYLNGKKDFSFTNLLVYKGDTVKVSFLNDSKELIKPKNIYFDTLKVNSLLKFEPENFDLIKERETKVNNSWKDLFFSNSTHLDEVTVVGKIRSQRYLERKKLLKKYQPLVFDIGKYYNLELPTSFKDHNNNIMSYLGFNEGVTLVNWNGVENYLRVGTNKEAILHIDGRLIGSDELNGVNLNMIDVENVFVQSIRGNRIYQVFTTENYKKGITLLYDEYVFKKGYDKEKKYYSPRYDYDTTNKTLNWVEIDWKTDLTPNAFGEMEFKIKQHKKLEGYLFSIQGFSDEGRLISEIIKK
ncbi:hypothetical protein [Aureibaculum sp. 2210JD6-5]|uniref:hypothetical protein n=1 Tax=Aureibaculum sp. 2210JD6-5 TaxID=3103957 RepID=UPI002ABDF72E|nr:hypothetical protein [Aureibaculum sp. 2210JD6-5]